jgi:hypothetical protein
MSLPISSLTAIAKTSIGATHYLPLADGTAANYKLLIQDLFPAMNTLGTTSESLFVNVTNKNTLNFKGIKSLDSLLTVATTSNNITLQVNPGNINLDDCDNSVSQFITGPIDLTSAITGALQAINGGTGLTTLTANSLFIGNGTSALTALGVANNGQIPIGRTGLSPVLANITAGTNVTVTNGSGSITIAASLTTLTANLNGAGYNIYGLGWLSGDGQNEGIAINSAGKVFIGSATPSAFYNYDLNVNNGIGLNGGLLQYISMGTSATPQTLIIQGTNSSSASTGGNVIIIAGTGSATAGGGVAYLSGGDASGAMGGGSVAITAGSTATGVAGNIGLNAGTTSGAGTGGNVLLTPGYSTGGTGGIVVQAASSTTRAFTNFTGTQTAASANSLSSSTASAAAKTGAIRIQINGVDAWIRVYATAE